MAIRAQCDRCGAITYLSDQWAGGEQRCRCGAWTIIPQAPRAPRAPEVRPDEEQTMDAIITAGGRIGGEFARQEGVTIKALLSLGSTTLLERTVGALRGSRHVERLCVVGPPEVEGPARAAGADAFALERTTGIDNLMAGLDALQARGRVLCAASDLPLVSASDVDDVVERTPAGAGLTYPVFTRDEWESAFPGSPATFITFADGEFTGSCVHVHDAAALRAIEPVLQRMFAARKSQVAMARILGAGLVVRMLAAHVLRLCARPSTEDARRRAEHLTGVPCALVRGCSPRIAADVDHASDWEYVKRRARPDVPIAGQGTATRRMPE